MHKAFAFFLIFFLIFPLLAFSQEDTNDDSPYSEDFDSDWDYLMPPLYSQGDKTFTISLGLVFPTMWYHNQELVDSKLNATGGTGALGFNYFLNSNIFLGGEIGGLFNGTIAGTMLFLVPIGLRGGYQFVAGKFEIPLSLTVGIAPVRHMAQEYFGMFIKGGSSLYYRYSPDWSFGLNAYWMWVPQWPADRTKDVYINFIDLTLAARYHF